MLRSLLLMAFLLNASISFAVNSGRIKLPKHNKIESTFSGDLSDQTSFHLIFTKNKKTGVRENFVYVFDGKEIDSLGYFSSMFKNNVSSFHLNDQTLSLLMSYAKDGKDFFRFVDVHLDKNKIEIHKGFSRKDLKTTIRKKNKSVLVYVVHDTLIVRSFGSSSSTWVKKFVLSEKGEKSGVFFKDLYIASVNTDEFVRNGPTSKGKAFLYDDKLIFSKDDEKKNVTSLLVVSLKNEASGDDFSYTEFKNSSGMKFKRMATYVFNDLLFQLYVDKKLGFLRVWDVNNGTNVSTTGLNEQLSRNFESDSSFIGLQKFLKEASRTGLHTPTITANQTLSDLIRVRIDYVDATHHYNQNWWFHHEFMRFHFNEFHMNNNFTIPRSGPLNLNLEGMHNRYEFVDNDRYFELWFNDGGELVLNDGSETVYKDINRGEYIAKLEEMKNYRFTSSCFLDHSFRFIAYSKSSDTVVIQTNRI